MKRIPRNREFIEIMHEIDEILGRAAMKPDFGVAVNYREANGTLSRAVIVYVHNDTCVNLVIERETFPPHVEMSVVLGDAVGQFQFVTE